MNMKIGKPVEEIPATTRTRGPLKYQDVLDALAKHPAGTTLPIDASAEDAGKLATALSFRDGPYYQAGVRTNRRGNTVYVSILATEEAANLAN